MTRAHPVYVFFFFNDTATTEIYTLSLHDALPISTFGRAKSRMITAPSTRRRSGPRGRRSPRSEEHTSELQSHLNLVCRLLLEKKKICFAVDSFDLSLEQDILIVKRLKLGTVTLAI